MTAPFEHDDPDLDPIRGTRVDVRRSARRRKSVQAYRDGDRIVVLVPDSFSRAEEARWVREMVAKVLRKEQRSRVGDADLLERATELSATYLDGAAVPASVRWVDNQQHRWGSCTVEDRTIRLSSRLQPMPDWVVDYVLLHELVHLLVPHHGREFWAHLEPYPRTERARGFLEGVAAGRSGLG